MLIQNQEQEGAKMKIKFDENKKALRYIPESTWDAFRLGVVITKIGWGSLTWKADGILVEVVFSAEGLLKYLEDGKPNNPNQPQALQLAKE